MGSVGIVVLTITLSKPSEISFQICFSKNECRWKKSENLYNNIWYFFMWRHKMTLKYSNMILGSGMFVRVVLIERPSHTECRTWLIFSPCSPIFVTVMLTAPELQAGHTLFSRSCAYSVLEFLGEGCFGQVVRCQNLVTKEEVAVKILKDTDFTQDTEKEVDVWTIWNMSLLRVCTNCCHVLYFLPRCPY